MVKTEGAANRRGFFQNIRKYRFLYGLALPTILWYALFAYIPMVGIVIAFQDFKYTKGIFASPLVGLTNFTFLFRSKNLWQITFNTVYLNVLFIVFNTFMAVLLSLMFVEIKGKRFKKLTQSVSILPHFISWTVVAMFLSAFTATDSGLINKMLAAVGSGTKLNFTSNAALWPATLVILRIWQGAGFGTIVYIATITGFDTGIYEAAQIDGASKWQQITRITLPMLRPTIVLLTIFSIGGIFRGDFGMIYALVGDNALLYATTDVIDTYVYRALRTIPNLGMSTAVSLYQSIVGFAIVLATNALARRFEPGSAIF